MGHDKATLEWRGQPLWKLQLQKLRALQPQEIFIAARADPPWRPADCPFVGDDAPSRGPLSGLVAALERCQTRHLLALAVDLPMLEAGELRRTLAYAATGCVPFLNERAEPLAAVYPRSALEEARNHLAQGVYSLQALVRKLIADGLVRERVVEAESHPLYLNANSPEQMKHPA